MSSHGLQYQPTMGIKFKVASELCLKCFLHSWDLFGCKCLQKNDISILSAFNFHRKSLSILNGKTNVFKIFNFINGLLLSSQANNNTFQHSDHSKTSPKIWLMALPVHFSQRPWRPGGSLWHSADTCQPSSPGCSAMPASMSSVPAHCGTPRTKWLPSGTPHASAGAEHEGGRPWAPSGGQWQCFVCAWHWPWHSTWQQHHRESVAWFHPLSSPTPLGWTSPQTSTVTHLARRQKLNSHKFRIHLYTCVSHRCFPLVCTSNRWCSEKQRRASSKCLQVLRHSCQPPGRIRMDMRVSARWVARMHEACLTHTHTHTRMCIHTSTPHI